VKVTQEQINSFLETKRFAIAGVSRNPSNFGHQVFLDLRQKDFDVLPVNPHTDNIDGIQCYTDVNSLPEDINRLLILTNKKQTNEILMQAIKKGIKKIWVQQMSETRETLEMAENNGIDVIIGKCIFMYVNPKGVHRFHRSILKLLGMLPK